MRDQFDHVYTLRIVQRRLDRLQRDHFRSGLVEQARRGIADVAEALDAHARAFHGQADPGRRRAPADEHAAPGGVAAPAASAQRERLAGHDRGRGCAVHHGVGVHHPGHDFFVGVDVGRGDVPVGADDDADFAGVAPGQTLEFGFGQLARVDAHAALGAAEGHADHCVLDAHPAGQSHHLGQANVLMEAHAALARAARGIVLHAVTLEVRDPAVVHPDRNIDDEDAFGALQRFHQIRKLAQGRRGAFDLLQKHTPGTDTRRFQIGGQCMRWVHRMCRPVICRRRMKFTRAGSE